MPSVHRFSLAVACAVLASAASCSDSPVEPEPAPTVHRSVTVVLTDTLGAPATGASTLWVAGFDSAGVAESRSGTTDAGGAELQVLAAGPWFVTAAAAPPFVAGASFTVSGAERALADTQVVRMVLVRGSRASGVATLAGRSEHGGTLVASEAGAVTVTDSTGAWALDGLPPGRWAVTMFHLGFRLGLLQVTVTSPGSSVATPPVVLVSDP